MSATTTDRADLLAIVTGHSRGLGEGIAQSLLERDVPVVGIARGGNASLARRFGKTLTQVTLDLSDHVAIERWLSSGVWKQGLELAGTVFLVNNSGVLQPIGPLQTQDPADVARAVAVNVGAVLMLSAAFVAATMEVKERRILHVSSGAGRKAYAGWSVYCATKAALDHHARAVALDATPRLRISSLAPGVVDTAMQAEIRATTTEHFPDKERFVTMKRESRLKRADTTGSAVVDFLLSDDFGSEPVSELPALR